MITAKPIKIPSYIPAAAKHRLEGREFNLPRLPLVIKRRMRMPEKIRVSEHAAKYRIVTDGPHQGKWRHEHAPHTVKIMDTYGLAWVREVWFCGVEQSGKTNTMINCLHWGADCDPGDIFYMMPTESTMAKVTGKKLKPLVEQSPRLSKYLSGKQDDITLSGIKLSHGVTIFPAWANSPASMATWSAKHCFGDEIDKGAELSGREADRVTLIRKRGRLYKGRYKRFFASTPAQLFIYKGTLECAQVWEWRVCCPDCDQLIKMEAEHLDIADLTVEQIDAGAQVYYTCHECGSQWDDVIRERAIRAGRWVCVKGFDIVRPARVGFHHRCYECLDVPLDEIAIAYLKSKNGTVAEKIAWANGYEAKDYKHEQVDRKEDFILRLVDAASPRGVVPRDVSYVMIIADTQRIGFHYKVVAFGYGPDLDLAMIDHGYVLTFKNLLKIAGNEFAAADGKKYRCLSGWIDSGGGSDPNHPKHSRTVEVYNFCRKNPFWHPVKGRRTMEQGWGVKRLDYYPSSVGKKVPIPGGLNLFTLNVTLNKDELARRLQIEPGDPSGITLHAETDSGYAKQLCAEYQDERGYWLCPRGKDNHQWDCWVYGLAAAEILRLRDFVNPAEHVEKKQVAKKKAKQKSARW